MEVAIIIVNYRTPDLTIDCLRSLVECGDLSTRAHIIVVDGNSEDESVPQIATAITQQNWSNWVTLLPLDVNGGFAYANNRGIESFINAFGKPSFIWLLNSDTIVRPGALCHLLCFMIDNPTAGIVGSRLEDPDGTPQHSAFRFHSILGEFESTTRVGVVSRLLGRWQVAPQIPAAAVRMDWVSGASMLIRTEVIDAVGMLDEAYFMYYEESDFCLHAARDGWECWYVPTSRIVHLVGRSSGVTSRQSRPGRRPTYWFESRRQYFVKNHGRVYTAMADAAWIGGYLLWQIRKSFSNRPDDDPPNLLHDFIRHSTFARNVYY